MTVRAGRQDGRRQGHPRRQRRQAGRRASWASARPSGPMAPFRITISLSDIGGPSAGLMFTLGIIDRLTARRPDRRQVHRRHRRRWRSTTTGTVGAIGGILLKKITARDAGATVLPGAGGQLRGGADQDPAGLAAGQGGDARRRGHGAEDHWPPAARRPAAERRYRVGGPSRWLSPRRCSPAAAISRLRRRSGSAQSGSRWCLRHGTRAGRHRRRMPGAPRRPAAPRAGRLSAAGRRGRRFGRQQGSAPPALLGTAAAAIRVLVRPPAPASCASPAAAPGSPAPARSRPPGRARPSGPARRTARPRRSPTPRCRRVGSCGDRRSARRRDQLGGQRTAAPAPGCGS